MVHATFILIFIIDLPELTKSACKIFADDTKLYESAANSATIQDDFTVSRRGVIPGIFISMHLNVRYCTFKKIILEMIIKYKLEPTLSMYKLAQKKKI